MCFLHWAASVLKYTTWNNIELTAVIKDTCSHCVKLELMLPAMLGMHGS